MATQDRLYIDIKVRATIEKMESVNFLESHSIKNREIILYAISRGIENPIPIDGKKDGFVNEKDLSMVDEALIYSCFIPQILDIESITDKNLVYDFVQRCANMGFKIIENEIEHHNVDTIDKNLLSELNDFYEKLEID